jgi:hypothetical protein
MLSVTSMTVITRVKCRPVFVRETLNKSAFYSELAQLCDAGSNKINGLPQLIQLQKFPVLFNQHFSRVSTQSEFNCK